MEVLPSALKHGIAAADILHCLNLALAVDEVDEDPLRYLILGPDRGGNILELIVVDRPNGPCVIHAMRMREQYQKLLPKKGEQQ